MAATIHPRALTTLARVKARLGISVSTLDDLLTEMISAATDLIESYCDRKFKSDTYTSEVYGLDVEDGHFVALKQAPVTALTTAQYRAGTPDVPAWTSYLASEFELVGDGRAGLVRIYGGVPTGTNNVRFTYTAGYLIDFTNEGDITKHTLPFDVSDLCERIVIRLFKRREDVGKTTVSAGEASVSYRASFDEEDKMTLERYRRVVLV
ncbi:MAG: head-tail connector protein [Patescibacteria group bacterium]